MENIVIPVVPTEVYLLDNNGEITSHRYKNIREILEAWNSGQLDALLASDPPCINVLE